MTLEKFNEQKAKFYEQEKAVLATQTELDKARNILEALENEKAEFIARQKEKLAENGTLSADEYVELKNKNSGLEARIEYYQALIVDFKNKLYSEQSLLFKQQGELKQIRSKLLSDKAELLFNQFIQQNEETLAEIYSCLFHTGKFKQDRNLTEKTEEQAIIEHLNQQIARKIKTDLPLNKELHIYSAQLANFIQKTPTELHKEKYIEQPKGLSSLINEL